jgi:hypothetical protein
MAGPDEISLLDAMRRVRAQLTGLSVKAVL